VTKGRSVLCHADRDGGANRRPTQRAKPKREAALSAPNELEIAAATSLPPVVDVRGALFGVDVNASYLVTESLRLGLFVGADAMYLYRPTVARAQSIFDPTPELDNNLLYTGSATSVGLNVNAGVRGTFDLGFY
jgi:hypothetical protein